MGAPQDAAVASRITATVFSRICIPLDVRAVASRPACGERWEKEKRFSLPATLCRGENVVIFSVPRLSREWRLEDRVCGISFCVLWILDDVVRKYFFDLIWRRNVFFGFRSQSWWQGSLRSGLRACLHKLHLRLRCLQDLLGYPGRCRQGKPQRTAKIAASLLADALLAEERSAMIRFCARQLLLALCALSLFPR